MSKQILLPVCHCRNCLRTNGLTHRLFTSAHRVLTCICLCMKSDMWSYRQKSGWLIFTAQICDMYPNCCFFPNEAGAPWIGLSDLTLGDRQNVAMGHRVSAIKKTHLAPFGSVQLAYSKYLSVRYMHYIPIPKSLFMHLTCAFLCADFEAKFLGSGCHSHTCIRFFAFRHEYMQTCGNLHTCG